MKMKKEYSKPVMKVVPIQNNCHLLSGSETTDIDDTPATGPSYARRYSWGSIWDEDEE